MLPYLSAACHARLDFHTVWHCSRPLRARDRWVLERWVVRPLPRYRKRTVAALRPSCALTGAFTAGQNEQAAPVWHGSLSATTIQQLYNSWPKKWRGMRRTKLRAWRPNHRGRGEMADAQVLGTCGAIRE